MCVSHVPGSRWEPHVRHTPSRRQFDVTVLEDRKFLVQAGLQSREEADLRAHIEFRGHNEDVLEPVAKNFARTLGGEYLRAEVHPWTSANIYLPIPGKANRPRFALSVVSRLSLALIRACDAMDRQSGP